MLLFSRARLHAVNLREKPTLKLVCSKFSVFFKSLKQWCQLHKDPRRLTALVPRRDAVARVPTVLLDLCLVPHNKRCTDYCEHVYAFVVAVMIYFHSHVISPICIMNLYIFLFFNLIFLLSPHLNLSISLSICFSIQLTLSLTGAQSS